MSHPRRLTRSLIFWCGASFLAFLLWAWVDTYRYWSRGWIAGGSSGAVFSAGTMDGRIGLAFNRRTGLTSTAVYRDPRPDFRRYDFTPGHFLMPQLSWQSRPYLSLPIPLLILLHLSLCSTLIYY